ncbi:aminotransferase class V-fold PLP-dependent enzyme [Shewanella sp. KJ10-1]|uniref:Aminotransferase class V-fold PLP-dependent enzyme n=1 Tax=Shewanella phaeophyticola TaxID=2978345 RepID=A0ABT2P194_9GAMM|nr:aminotransferase class V-fold PLP-dependent enzyme [Shewanella sp. KJ10-1]MCT8985430.1 aminotransferase class V-fold PLP-dependent enzyme [Shewanella sp. KJ10-1]
MKSISPFPSQAPFVHQAIRDQFPALKQTLGDHPLCYLDTAATSQKPQAVIDAMNEYYQLNNANVHRAAHQLSAQPPDNMKQCASKLATLLIHQSRKKLSSLTARPNQSTWSHTA